MIYTNTNEENNFATRMDFDVEELVGFGGWEETPSDNAGNKGNYDEPWIQADEISNWEFEKGSLVQLMLDEKGYDAFIEELRDNTYYIPEDVIKEYPDPIFYLIPSLEERTALTKSNVGNLKKVFGFEKIKAACQVVAERKWFWGMIESWQEVYSAIEAEAKKM